MKKILSFTLFFLLTAVLSSDGLYSDVHAKKKADPAKKEMKRCELCYIMHPEFNLLDENGGNASASGKISSNKTCGKCHDADFINMNSTHTNETVKASCIQCHFEGGKINVSPESVSPDGRLKKGHIRIKAPAAENCAACHGVVHVNTSPLSIPDDFAASIKYSEGKKTYSLTAFTGEIISEQYISDSHLNLKNKKDLTFPWDSHAMRNVECSSCHFVENDPRRCGNTKADINYLVYDPRENSSIGRYLFRPSHKLKKAECESCHNPYAVHDKLPYKKRHFETLSCQSCHSGKMFGPAAMTIDRTVALKSGAPRIEYRGINPADASALSAKFNEGYVPFLMEAEPVIGKRSRSSIFPGNLVTEYRWAAADGKTVAEEKILAAFVSPKGDYLPEAVKLFDKNKNGSLEETELVLDSDEKISFVKKSLEAAGIRSPSIKGEVTYKKVNHGVMDEKNLVLDCTSCHSSDGRLGGDAVLSGFAPAGVIPEPDAALKKYLNGEIVRGKAGTIILKRDSSLAGHYVFGHGRIVILDVIGILAFIFSVSGAGAHGFLRWRAYRLLSGKEHKVKMKKVYMYTLYERVWHWTMALSVLFLMLTGIEIHYAGGFSLFGLKTAVDLHNGFAALVAVNAALALFYHIATGEIKQFFRLDKKFAKEVVVQGIYYVYGIFKGAPHPIEKTAERKLNPLQQITYVALLNVMFPYQIITGLLMWGAAVSPTSFDVIGGLSVIAPLHNLGSWMFLAFLAVHVYLTTTGHTPLANIKAMITGYDELEDEHKKKKVDDNVTLNEIVSNVKNLLKKNK